MELVVWRIPQPLAGSSHSFKYRLAYVAGGQFVVRYDKAMTGAGELAIREVARRVGRDVKAVHGDVSVLLQCGLLDKTGSGKVIFPYDAYHLHFT